MPNENAHLEVWSIRDGEGSRPAYWKHVGRAYRNRDGSINVILEALPLGAKMVIREGPPPVAGKEPADAQG